MRNDNTRVSGYFEGEEGEGEVKEKGGGMRMRMESSQENKEMKGCFVIVK